MNGLQVAGAVAAFDFSAPVRVELVAQTNEARPVVLRLPSPVIMIPIKNTTKPTKIRIPGVALVTLLISGL